MAAFLGGTETQSKVFIYPFHTDSAMLDTYFQQNFKSAVFEFSFENLVRELRADTARGRDVIVLLTSSANYVRALRRRRLTRRRRSAAFSACSSSSSRQRFRPS